VFPFLLKLYAGSDYQAEISVRIAAGLPSSEHRLVQPLPPTGEGLECLKQNGLAFLRWASIWIMIRKICQNTV
jgi:hypothetical protein